MGGPSDDQPPDKHVMLRGRDRNQERQAALVSDQVLFFHIWVNVADPCQAAGYPWPPCVACQSLDTAKARLWAPPELWCEDPGHVLQSIFPGVGPSALAVWGASDEASPCQGDTQGRVWLAGSRVLLEPWALNRRSQWKSVI